MFADGPEEVRFRPIGVVRSPFSDLDGMPLQSVAAADVEGRIEIRPDLVPGLRDLDGFSHIHVVTFLHRSRPDDLVVVPYLDFDVVDADRTGWLAHGAPRVHEIRSDWR